MAGFLAPAAPRAGPSMPVALLAGVAGTAIAMAEDESMLSSDPVSDSEPACMDVGARAVNKALCTCLVWSQNQAGRIPCLPSRSRQCPGRRSKCAGFGKIVVHSWAMRLNRLATDASGIKTSCVSKRGLMLTSLADRNVTKLPGSVVKYRDLRDFRSTRTHGRTQAHRRARLHAPGNDRDFRPRAARPGPALLFENAQHDGRPAQMPVLANLFGTPARVARGMGADDVSALRDIGELLACCASPRRPGACVTRWPRSRC